MTQDISNMFKVSLSLQRGSVQRLEGDLIGRPRDKNVEFKMDDQLWCHRGPWNSKTSLIISDLSRGIVVELRSSRQELVSQEFDQRLRPTPNKWLKAEPSWDTFGLSCGPAVPWQWWLHSTRQGMLINTLSATDVAPISLHLNSAAPKRLYQFQDLILKIL